MISGFLSYILFYGLLCALGLFTLVRRRRRPSTFPPGPLSLPIVGNLHQFGLKPHKTFMKIGEKYGPIFAMDFASVRAVVINDYKLIKQCFNENSFSGRPNLRYFAERTGGIPRGLVCSSYNISAEQRGFVHKTLREFGIGKPHVMETHIHEEITELIENLKKRVGIPVSTKTMFNAAVINSLWKLCAGERFDLDDPKFQEVVTTVSNSVGDSKFAGVAFFFPTLTKLAPDLTGYNTLLQIQIPVLELIRKKLEERKSSYDEADTRDLIDSYWQKILSTTDPESSFYKTEGELNMLYSLVDLFLAGAETTSTTLSWTFLILSLYPDVQEKLHEEIREKVGDNRLPGINDRINMPYTECVILEVLRYCALVPLGVFHNTTQEVELDGYILPKDTMVVSNLYAALRDPVWGDPEKFRPERFLLPDGTVDRYHPAHLVFSVGKRVCLGEALARTELFLFTTSLFQRFQVTYNPKRAKPNLEDVNCSAALSPKYHELILYERHQDVRFGLNS